jgi:N-dimethylarginine dimethylaminohydrolase
VPVLSSEDAEATGGDVVTTDTEALTEGERERTDTRASSQLCDEMGEKMAQTEG